MGLLDFLFKRGAKRVQPTQPFRAHSVSLSELALRAEEAKRAEVAKALPEVEASTHRLRSQWSALEKKTSGLAKRNVTKGIDGEKIALQSRDDFARRAEYLFKSSRFPEREDIDSFAHFAHEFERALHVFARALADNKYLFLFFKDDTTEIGRTINELNDEAMTLKHSVESARKNSERYALLLRRIGELQALRGKNAEFTAAVKRAEDDVSRAAEKEKNARVEFEGEERSAAQTKIDIAALDNDVWTAENEVAQFVSLLQRPFRKLEKFLESKEEREGAPRNKGVIEAMRDYASNGVKALARDDEVKGLALACEALEKNLSELGLDLKEAEKANAAIDASRSGKIAGAARMRREALQHKEQKTGALAPLERAKRAFEDAGEARQEAALKLKAAQAKLAASAASIRLEKDAIDKAANSLFKLSLSE